MKNALILHGTGGNAQGNWFPWLKDQLEQKEYTVWVPDLPQADKPSIKRYAQFIFANKDWEFTQESVFIGHSSGAVAVLGLLQKLPESVSIDTAILVGAFQGDLGWEKLRDLYDEEFDYSYLKAKARRYVFIHSDNDPHCPFEGAKALCDKVEGTMVWVQGAGHFNEETGGDRFKEFPLIIDVLEGHSVASKPVVDDSLVDRSIR